MTIQTVTDAIRYVGVDDNTLALFENQYPVQPMGVSYNSYVILDEKIAVMDTQSVNKFGGYGIRAKEEAEAQKLISDAIALEKILLHIVVISLSRTRLSM